MIGSSETFASVRRVSVPTGVCDCVVKVPVVLIGIYETEKPANQWSENAYVNPILNTGAHTVLASTLVGPPSPRASKAALVIFPSLKDVRVTPMPTYGLNLAWG